MLLLRHLVRWLGTRIALLTIDYVAATDLRSPPCPNPFPVALAVVSVLYLNSHRISGGACFIATSLDASSPDSAPLPQAPHYPVSAWRSLDAAATGGKIPRRRATSSDIAFTNRCGFFIVFQTNVLLRLLGVLIAVGL